MDIQKIKDTLTFYKWSKIDASIRTERPVEFTMDEFFADIRQNPPEVFKKTPYVINNTYNGKAADDFTCPSMVFIDIDFHFDNEQDKIVEVKRFYDDTDTKSFQEFVDLMKKDKYCISAGVSKSGVGVRLFFHVTTKLWLDTLEYDLDYSTDMNKQIHESNWKTVMNYLSLYYNLDLDAEYSGDKTPGRLHQVTYKYLLDGSFYNTNWESMFNQGCHIREKKKYVSTGTEEKYEVEFLDDLYELNKEQFDDSFVHYDKMSSINYMLRTQPDSIIGWFYNKIKENYQGKGYLVHLKDFDSFRKNVTKSGGDDLPLRGFLFKRGITYSEPFTEFNLPEEEDEKEVNEKLIPQSVYDKLPEILKDVTSDFKEEKRDVVLLASLNSLAYYFSNVRFTYFFDDNQYNNFYTFILANSSAGKSIMNNGKKLLYDIDRYYRDKFNKEITAYNAVAKKTTIPPIEVCVVCGGDATRQGLTKYLQNNNGKLLLFDTEADSLLTQNGDFDYSTLIRRCLQNESVTKLLAGQNIQYVETPKLNICVSGTKSQLLNMIGEKGSENGTFNRFIFYSWDTEPTIESPHQKIKNNKCADYSKQLLDFYMENLHLDGFMEFNFTDKQIEYFDSKLIDLHKFYLAKEDDSTSGIIKRHFLIVKKMCVTMAGLRMFDAYKANVEDPYTDETMRFDFTNLEITDSDLKNTIELITTLIKHSIELFRKFTPIDETPITTSWKEDIYSSLPDEFTRLTIINKGSVYKKSARTIDRWLKKMKDDNTITKLDKTTYKKIKSNI